MPKKIDYRIQLTKKMFKNAFFQLLKEKSIQEITIKELCATAQVNRGTFYSHYEDIYQLLHSIEDEMYQELLTTLSSLQFTASTDREFYIALFEFFVNNAEMCTMLISKNSDQEFLNKILLVGLSVFMSYYEDKTVLPPDQLRALYHFVSGGCVSLLKVWFEDGMVHSCSEMADLLRSIITLGIIPAITN